MSKLMNYNVTSKELSSLNQSFKSAVMELDNDVKNKIQNIESPVIDNSSKMFGGTNIVGLIDFQKNELSLLGKNKELIYDLDNLDPAYVDLIKMTLINQSKLKSLPKEFPLSDISLELLDSQFDDKTKIPDLNDVKLENHLTESDVIFQRSFANEMVLLAHLDEFIKEHDLNDFYAKHEDEFIQRAHSKAFDYDFENATKELQAETVVRYAEEEHNQLML